MPNTRCVSTHSRLLGHASALPGNRAAPGARASEALVLPSPSPWAVGTARISAGSPVASRGRRSQESPPGVRRHRRVRGEAEHHAGGSRGLRRAWTPRRGPWLGLRLSTMGRAAYRGWVLTFVFSLRLCHDWREIQITSRRTPFFQHSRKTSVCRWRKPLDCVSHLYPGNLTAALFLT